jgi:CRISPR/Cas system Type II protein with McrA/HNH and RuvC-like nuclease domain
MSIKLAQKKYYLENKDKVQWIINKYNREYFSTTIEWNFLNRCIARRKSAKKKYSHFTEHKHDIDKYTFWELLEKQNGICPLTGVSLILTDRNTGKDYFIYEIDHIIPCNQPGSYHGKDNIQLVFPYSNAIKSNKW